MFGKLTLEQRKALQAILIQSRLVDTYQQRVKFLEDNGLDRIIRTLPMEEDINIFVGALIREVERLGAPPDLGEYVTVLLALSLRNGLSGHSEIIFKLNEIISVYVTDHIKKYPFDTPKNNSESYIPETHTSVLNAGILKPPIKILVLAASPVEMEALRLDREMVAIQNAIQSSTNRDAFLSPILIPAVQPDELITLLKRHKPTLVHFAGHGAQEDGLFFLNEHNAATSLRPELLARIFSLRDIKQSVQGVVLNACWSEPQAKAIHAVNKIFVVGATQQISDKYAIAFARGFYMGLGEGDTIPDAFETGCTQAAVQLNDYDALGYTRILSSS